MSIGPFDDQESDQHIHVHLYRAPGDYVADVCGACAAVGVLVGAGLLLGLSAGWIVVMGALGALIAAGMTTTQTDTGGGEG